VGTMVGGFLVPHDPVMFVAPEAADPAVARRIWDAYATCAARLRELAPTAVIIVGADHYLNFGPGCLPQYLIGTGDVEGPLDVLPGLKRQVIPDRQDLAVAIAAHGHAHGFDWAVARAFSVDHAVAIPDRLIVQPARAAGQSIGTIPVYVAAGVDPYISLRRCLDLGAALRAAVGALPESERVVIIGSGGLSHWVGTPEMGRVNETFDRMIMQFACSADHTGLAALGDDYILAEGGNGGMEVRQWAVAMGAMAGATGRVIEYASVTEWITGLGFVELIAGGVQ